MPCRSDFPVYHDFPPHFPKDTDYLVAALAEYNLARPIKLRFDQLNSQDMQCVLRRSQEMKGSGAGFDLSPQAEASPDPAPVSAGAWPAWPARVGRWIRCRLSGRKQA